MKDRPAQELEAVVTSQIFLPPTSPGVPTKAIDLDPKAVRRIGEVEARHRDTVVDYRELESRDRDAAPLDQPKELRFERTLDDGVSLVALLEQSMNGASSSAAGSGHAGAQRVQAR
jgi:hypothetical protein